MCSTHVNLLEASGCMAILVEIHFGFHAKEHYKVMIKVLEMLRMCCIHVMDAVFHSLAGVGNTKPMSQ